MVRSVSFAWVVASIAVASIAHAQPTPVERDACGEAAFTAADVEGSPFESFTITFPATSDMAALVRAVVAQTQAASSRAQRVVERYESVRPCTSPTWTIAAYARQARMYEVLAHVIVSSAAGIPGGAAAVDRVRESMQTALAPVECMAVVRYVYAVRAARAAAIASPFVSDATLRLRAYGTERVTQCIDDQRTRDSSFAAFTPADIEPVVK